MIFGLSCRPLAVVSAAVMLLWSSTAVAGPDDGDITFDTLEPSVTDADELRLDYEFDDDSWDQFVERDLAPQLVVYMKDDGGDELGYAYSFHLTHQDDSLIFPRKFRAHRIDELHLDMHAYEGSWRVRTLEAGGIRGWRLAFESTDDGFTITGLGAFDDEEAMTDLSIEEDDADDERPRRRARHRRSDGWREGEQTRVRSERSWSRENKRQYRRRGADEKAKEETKQEDAEQQQADDGQWRADVVEACSDITRQSSDRETCVAHALEVEPSWAEDVIRACDDANRYSSDTNECIEEARHYQEFNPADVVEACDDANRYSSDRQQCLQRAASYEDFDPVPVVEACGDTNRYTSDRHECMEHAAAYHYDPTPVIEACDEATRFSSDRNECVEYGAYIDAGDTAIIEACSGRDVADCIRQATGH